LLRSACDIERAEQALFDRAREDGLDILPRPDASPLAVLNVVVVKGGADGGGGVDLTLVSDASPGLSLAGFTMSVARAAHCAGRRNNSAEPAARSPFWRGGHPFGMAARGI
jgi:hypothetical protein